MAVGLTAGDYIRVGGGITSPVGAQGSLKSFKTGAGAMAYWENWQNGGTGVGRVGFGLGVGYSTLPFDSEQFVSESGGTVRSATGDKAGILEIISNVRVRFPAPVVIPAITFGFGFINWMPGKIHPVDATTGQTSSVTFQHRGGAELSIGGSLDRQLFDRYAAYVEAAYVYGYTSFGRGFTTPGGLCSTSGCDPLKNTTVGVIRGGLRVKIKD